MGDKKLALYVSYGLIKHKMKLIKNLNINFKINWYDVLAQFTLINNSEWRNPILRCHKLVCRTYFGHKLYAFHFCMFFSYNLYCYGHVHTFMLRASWKINLLIILLLIKANIAINILLIQKLGGWGRMNTNRKRCKMFARWFLDLLVPVYQYHYQKYVFLP